MLGYPVGMSLCKKHSKSTNHMFAILYGEMVHKKERYLMNNYVMILLLLLASENLFANDNPTKYLEQAIVSGDLSRVEKEFSRFENKVDVAPHKKKYVKQLVEFAQDIADESPTSAAQPSRVQSIAKRAAKLTGGSMLLALGHAGVLGTVFFAGSKDNDYRAGKMSGLLLFGLCVSGLTLASWVTGLGAWLFNKGMTECSSVGANGDAQAIVAFLLGKQYELISEKR